MPTRIHPLDLAGYLGIPALVGLLVFGVLRLALAFLESSGWIGLLLLQVCLWLLPVDWIAPESSPESLVAVLSVLVWGSLQTFFVVLLLARKFGR